MKQRGIDSAAFMLGLTMDDARCGAYGSAQGYVLCLQELKAVNQYLLYLPVKGNAESIVHLKSFLVGYVGQTPALLWAEYTEHHVEARFMRMSPVMDAAGICDFVHELTALLKEQGFVSCCMDCGTGDEPLSICGINGAYRVLCPVCFESRCVQYPMQTDTVQKSILPGVLLGSLPGLLIIVLFLCFTVFPAPAGILVGVLAAVSGQKCRKKPLNKSAVWMTIGCCTLLLLLAFWVGLGAQIYITYSPYYYITFWDAVRSVPVNMMEGLLWLNGLVGLFSSLVLMAAGVILTIKSSARHVRPVAEAVCLQ